MKKFHLFRSDEGTHIKGHKSHTMNKEYKTFNPKYVYIPSVDNRNNPLNNSLKVGDLVKIGTLLGTKAPDDFPVYSSISGKIVDIVDMLLASGSTQKCFKIKNDFKNEEIKYAPLGDVKDVSEEEILEAMKKSGTIGFGGAGFPTYRKYNSGKEVDYIIINAIECEPYLTTDYIYGVKMIDYLFKALPYLLKLTKAKEVAFCTKKDKPALIEGCLNEIKKYPDLPIKLYKCEDLYPMGYERNLVYEVAHKEYQVLPIEVKCIVNNIYSLICLGKFFTEGAIPSLRCITVAGHVNNALDIVTPYGALAKDLIDLTGGITIDGDAVLINGGPMNGNTLSKMDFVTLLQTNGIIVRMPLKLRSEPCWHCGMCSDHCSMNLQPVQIQMALKRNDVKRLIELKADMCCGCGMCSYICPSKIDVKVNIQQAKFMVMEEKRRQK